MNNAKEIRLAADKNYKRLASVTIMAVILLVVSFFTTIVPSVMVILLWVGFVTVVLKRAIKYKEMATGLNLAYVKDFNYQLETIMEINAVLSRTKVMDEVWKGCLTDDILLLKENNHTLASMINDFGEASVYSTGKAVAISTFSKSDLIPHAHRVNQRLSELKMVIEAEQRNGSESLITNEDIDIINDCMVRLSKNAEG